MSLSQIELVWVRVRMEWELRVFLSESERSITRCLNPRWQCLNPTWQNSRWLPSSSWVRMNEFESDWISLSQSFVQRWLNSRRLNSRWVENHYVSQMELVWVRVRLEEECFWVNLREDNKVSESKMAVSESNLAEFKMAAIIKLSHNQWVKVFFFVQIVGTNLGKCEWVWERKTNMAECKLAEFKMAAIIQVEWEWMMAAIISFES